MICRPTDGHEAMKTPLAKLLVTAMATYHIFLFCVLELT